MVIDECQLIAQLFLRSKRVMMLQISMLEISCYIIFANTCKNVFARFSQTSRIFANFTNFCTNVAYLPRKQQKCLKKVLIHYQRLHFHIFFALICKKRFCTFFANVANFRKLYKFLHKCCIFAKKTTKVLEKSPNSLLETAFPYIFCINLQKTFLHVFRKRREFSQTLQIFAQMLHICQENKKRC